MIFFCMSLASDFFSHSGRMKSNENYRLSRIWYLSLPVDGENRKFPIISVGRVECQLVVVVVMVRALLNRAPLMIRPPTSIRRLFFFVCFLSFGNTFKQKYIYLNTHTDTQMSNVISVAGAKTGGLRRGRAHTTHETGSSSSSFVSNFPPTI